MSFQDETKKIEDEVKEEIKEEVKEEIKKELKEEVKKDLKEEIETNLKNELKSTIKENIKEDIIKEEQKESGSPFLKTLTKPKETTSPGFADEIDQDEVVRAQEKYFEEHEKGDIKFKAHCKLFRMSSVTNKLEQRGIGRILITKDEGASLYKIVMVRDKIMKLGCNHYIEPWVELVSHTTAEFTWIWCTTADTCDDKVSEPKQTYVAKFKNQEDSDGFLGQFNIARAKNEIVLKQKAEDKKRSS